MDRNYNMENRERRPGSGSPAWKTGSSEGRRMSATSGRSINPESDSRSAYDRAEAVKQRNEQKFAEQELRSKRLSSLLEDEDDFAVDEQFYRQSTRSSQREPSENTYHQPARDIRREPVRETRREPVRETRREPVRETRREPVRETCREPIRETRREPVRETRREPVRETRRESVRETRREPIREQYRDNSSRYSQGGSERRSSYNSDPRRSSGNSSYSSGRTPSRKHKKNNRKKAVMIIFLIALIAVGFIVFGLINGIAKSNKELSKADQKVTESDKDAGKKKKKKEEAEEKPIDPDSMEGKLNTAAFQAAQYDYDAAIATLKTIDKYEKKEDVLALIDEYEATKASCVQYPVEEITHIFFHSLLFEPEVSFGPTSQQPDGYNLYMTTVDEFNKIIQNMYDKGFVLVSLYDVAHEDASGNFVPGTIMLPPGKKAFVLSQDDVCYYHAYDNGGIADKILIDPETGKIKTQYTYQDGRVEIGDHDVLPILDTFIEEHPDFSYRGAKGVLALTGYNGILGYRTDPTYNTTEDRDQHEQAWLDAHPDFNYEEECEEARKVAQAIKDDGWLLASHSWGHLWQDKQGSNGFAVDTQKWMDRVYPLIGGTDIWIYPNGEDVDCNKWQDRFQILLADGFKYFCPVDPSQYTVRIDSYGLNMGRRNLDGYRMNYDMTHPDVDKLSDLYDVNEVYDSRRPPMPEL